MWVWMIVNPLQVDYDFLELEVLHVLNHLSDLLDGLGLLLIS